MPHGAWWPADGTARTAAGRWTGTSPGHKRRALRRRTKRGLGWRRAGWRRPSLKRSRGERSDGGGKGSCAAGKEEKSYHISTGKEGYNYFLSRRRIRYTVSPRVLLLCKDLEVWTVPIEKYKKCFHEATICLHLVVVQYGECPPAQHVHQLGRPVVWLCRPPLVSRPVLDGVAEEEVEVEVCGVEGGLASGHEGVEHRGVHLHQLAGQPVWSRNRDNVEMFLIFNINFHGGN